MDIIEFKKTHKQFEDVAGSGNVMFGTGKDGRAHLIATVCGRSFCWHDDEPASLVMVGIRDWLRDRVELIDMPE